METKELIQQRIKNRKNKTNVNKKYFPMYRFFMSFLALTSLCLSFLIFAKKDEDNASLLCSKIGLNIDFGKINSNISGYFDSIIGLDFLKKSFYESSQEVSNQTTLLPLGDDYFTNDEFTIKALDGGVVVYVGETDDLYDITVAYDNNISVVYSSIDEIFVSLMDRIEIDDTIAKFSDKFKMVILKMERR